MTAINANDDRAVTESPTLATTSPSEDGSAHAHEWQAHGLVREKREQVSPCSRWDDVLYTAVYAVQSCSCGKVKKTHVANENQRRRGDGLRRGQR